MRSDARTGQVTADLAEKPGVGAAEPVDRLLRIADHIELAGCRCGFPPISLARIGSGKQEQNLRLERIGVLKLIHEDSLVILLELCPCTVVLQELAGVQK